MKNVITAVILSAVLMVAVGCSSKTVVEEVPVEEVQNVERG